MLKKIKKDAVAAENNPKINTEAVKEIAAMPVIVQRPFPAFI